MQGGIDIIHDTRHFCTHHIQMRSKMAGIVNNGIKAMSRGISRGKQKIKFANGGMLEFAVDFVYSLKTRRRFNSHANCTV